MAPPVFVALHRTQSWLYRESKHHDPLPIIVGSPRSGTTLLRLMLDSHPDLAIPPETGFIIPVSRLYGAGARLRRSFFQVLTNFPPEASGWRDFGIPTDEFWQELEQIRPFSVRAGLRCFYRIYADRFHKPRCGDKTPTYGLNMHTIQQMLPEARFIHLIRDGRDAALSLRNLWFSPAKDMETLAERWTRGVSKMRSQGQKCRHYLEVRYEELVLNPTPVLKQVCEFCDLNYDPRMQTFFERAPERLQEHRTRKKSDGSIYVTSDQRMRQSRRTMSPLDPSRVYVWKRKMTQDERMQFEKIAGILLSELGYETRA